MRDPETLRTSIPREKLGPPGIPSQISLVPRLGTPFENEERDRALLGDRREREFRVTVHLARTVALADTDLDFRFDKPNGSSLLRAPPNIVLLGLDTPAGRIKLHTNEQREVSALEFTCQTQSPDGALELYGQAVAPILDAMAYSHDVPLIVKAISWFDVSNAIVGATYTAPYSEIDVRGLSGKLDLALRPFYALYREAITNSSVYYQFLCFVKILEGALHWLLPRIRKETEEQGIALESVHPRIPALDPLSSSAEARAFEGRSMSDAFKDYLLPEFRVAVAHFAEEGEDPLLLSSSVANARYSGALQLARVCAREAISMLSKYLLQIATHRNSR